MVKLIIRDDDLNFFSNPDDLAIVYSPIEGFPVTYAIIPNVLDVSTKGKCPETRGNNSPKWIGNNTKLISWLKENLKNGKVDVLMHGITHEYKTDNGIRLPEMVWRDEADLQNEIASNKDQLEKLLDYPISMFVAPSNKISKYGIKCVAGCGLHFSGIVPLNFQRDLTLRNIYNWIKRLCVRLIYRIPYPGVLSYSDHLELNACGIQSYDYLVKMFKYCDNHNLPMAINVHYWHIRDNRNKYEDFFNFIHYALNNGAQPATMTEVLKVHRS